MITGDSVHEFPIVQLRGTRHSGYQDDDGYVDENQLAAKELEKLLSNCVEFPGDAVSAHPTHSR